MRDGGTANDDCQLFWVEGRAVERSAYSVGTLHNDNQAAEACENAPLGIDTGFNPCERKILVSSWQPTCVDIVNEQ